MSKATKTAGNWLVIVSDGGEYKVVDGNKPMPPDHSRLAGFAFQEDANLFVWAREKYQPSKSADPWHNNEVQFARLIEELSAAGVFHDREVMATLRESMDLKSNEIKGLVNRATKFWEQAKADIGKGDSFYSKWCRVIEQL